jgi:HSP20 family molecular chaperone IbpA
MSNCSFTQTYPTHCLLDYERLQHQHQHQHQQTGEMDHYQIHTHPLPNPPTHHTTTTHTTWSPKFPFHLPQPYDWHHPHILSSIASLAQPPVPVPSFPLHVIPPWVPRTDIRETKHAYHIEIELPGVTDKTATTIQWLEDRTLLVRGQVGGPIEEGKVSGGERGHGDGDKKGEGDGDEVDKDWCSLSPTHATDALTNANPLERILSTKEQEIARGTSSHGPKSHPTPNHTASSPHTSPTGPATYLLRERPTGLWQRTFSLPMDVDLKGMKATLRGGLLEIVAMKRCVDGGKGKVAGRVDVQ